MSFGALLTAIAINVALLSTALLPIQSKEKQAGAPSRQAVLTLCALSVGAALLVTHRAGSTLATTLESDASPLLLGALAASAVFGFASILISILFLTAALRPGRAWARRIPSLRSPLRSFSFAMAAFGLFLVAGGQYDWL